MNTNISKNCARSCVIVDIDGTLADCHHRRRYITRMPKQWNKFFDPDLVSRDKLIQPVARLVDTLASQHLIVYSSGRPERLRETTVDWLSEHDLWFHPFELYMRSDGDMRPDVTVKRELLRVIEREGFSPWLTIDDRSSVVSMWREEGLTCLQVADGDF
ncbi:MAG TPA: polynucleotide kinase [Candidatus Melainabacteria bacterium]|nr:polynucleotide kinase [Candidatus Melainabacteria bacterium]